MPPQDLYLGRHSFIHLPEKVGNMWNRENVEFIQSQDLAWVSVPFGEFGAAGSGTRKILSEDKEDGSITSLVKFRTPQVGTMKFTADLFVLQGYGELNGKPLAPGHYGFLLEGQEVNILPTNGALVLYFATFSKPVFEFENFGNNMPLKQESIFRHVESMTWDSPEWNGDQPLEPGVGLKWLRRNDYGISYFSAKLPGWESPQEESHPNFEESFKVYGDTLLGRTGIMTAGSYFFHRPQFWHAPLYVKTGTASVVRANVNTSTTYRQPAYDWEETKRLAYLNLDHPALGQTWN